MLAVGLTLLADLMLETMADQQNEPKQVGLSGPANRRGFERRVRSLTSASPEGPHAVAVCDLDHFKGINETYGHHVGDLVIQRFGKVLRNSAPAIAPTGRIGDEQFVVFFSSKSGLSRFT